MHDSSSDRKRQVPFVVKTIRFRQSPIPAISVVLGGGIRRTSVQVAADAVTTVKAIVAAVLAAPGYARAVRTYVEQIESRRLLGSPRHFNDLWRYGRPGRRVQ